MLTFACNISHCAYRISNFDAKLKDVLHFKQLKNAMHVCVCKRASVQLCVCLSCMCGKVCLHSYTLYSRDRGSRAKARLSGQCLGNTVNTASMANATVEKRSKSKLHCCVPECFSDLRKEKDNDLSFHTLPTDVQLWKQWVVKICCDISADLEVSRHTFVHHGLFVFLSLGF